MIMHMLYAHGGDVRIGDRVTLQGIQAFVESLHDVGDMRLGVDKEDLPAFMIASDEYGRVLITVGSDDWEDISFVHRIV